MNFAELSKNTFFLEHQRWLLLDSVEHAYNSTSVLEMQDNDTVNLKGQDFSEIF